MPKLDWTETPVDGFTVYTCRAPGGIPLKISCDVPPECLSHKLHATSNKVDARMTHFTGDGWKWVAAITLYRTVGEITVIPAGVCPLDPAGGPLDTPANRLAALHRAYPVAVARLKQIADSLFARRPDEEPVVVSGPTSETLDPEVLASLPASIVRQNPGTVIMVPGAGTNGLTLALPFLGLTLREGVEKAVEAAKTHGVAVRLTTRMGTVRVSSTSDVDEVVRQLCVAGR